MLCFFVVTKLLMLKLLLASISGLHAYDFGYHPSAEEFDNFLRETQRTWTRDLLANEHRRAWNAKPPFRDVAEKFVPKYNYDKEQSQTATKQVTSWPGHVQRIGRPQQHRYESPSVAAAAHALKGNAVGSSLSFHLFSSEQNEDADGDGAAGEVNAADLPGVLKFSNLQPQTRPPNSKPSRPQRPNKQTLSSVIEIATSAESPKRPTQANQSFGGFYKNHTDTQFPIYFSNPVTGIIYAITEVGRVPHNISKPTSANSTISLYVSKEQYERDLYLQRKYYEQSCQSVPVKHLPKRNSTVTIAHTTTPPQIIRLQKPSTFKLPIAKLPGHLNKPPPVTVQTELTISDQVQLPTRKHKPKVKRKNKKKPNRPGRKPTVTRNELPQIIKGVRVSTPKPQTSTEKLQVATQLEKPNYTQTVFTKSDQSEEHQVRKRSVTNIRAYTDHAQNVTIIDKYLKDPAALHSIHEVEKVKDKSMAAKIVTARTRTAKRARVRKRQSKLGNYTEMNPLTNSAFNRTNWDVLKQHKRGYNATNSRNDTAIKPAWTNHTVNYDATTQLPSIALSTSRNNAQKRKTKSKRRRRKEKVEKRGEFDLFDFGDDEDEDDDDEESADRNDGEDDEEDDDNAGSYEDEDWSYYEFEPTSSTKTKKRKRHKNHKESKDPESFEEAEDYTDETSETSELTNHPANSIIINDGSSAEPGADFGAIESEENSLTSPPTTTTTTTTTTTKKPSIYTKAASKKRIRRRPTSSDSSASYEDYDYEDGGGVGGIGGFFRMIFYPVQVLMNGMADNFVSKESDEEQYSYPTYTTYHNGIQPIESIEEEEEEQSNSLASWLSSWFGFNRRTKNIGSTTPLPPSPSPTEPPSWLESWFGFGSQTTTTDSMPEDAKWFFGWFDSKPRRRRKTTTTTTTVHTPAAQVPILTIVDPLKNPQNWIGILAHHIINATASTVTQNPLMNAISQATVNPDVPRKVTYDRYQIWRLKPIDDTQVHALEEYKKSEDGIKGQWLKGPSLRGLTDVLVPPKQLLDFEASLSFESIAHEVLIYDVGKAIAYEQAQEQFHFNAVMHKNKKYPQKHQQQALTTMSWHKYYEYDDIITHLEMLRMRHPQLIELIHIGRSYEGRPLVVVKIESKDHAASVASQTLVAQKKLNSKKQTKEANSVFIESGTHGLEWIGPATSLWMISELLRLIKSNKTTIDNEYIKNTTWYFMPILNPDGYVYSHKYDRFWRKTRSRHISRRNGIIDSAMTWLQQKKIATRVCYGVDLDRNWHYQWGKRGSSKSPCNELYAGPGPFSEPESKALSEFLIDYRKQIKLYISLQQYGQIISYPLKANTSFNAERIDDFLDVAMVGTDGLRKRGSKSRYKIDSTSDLVENRSGCSDAFAAYEVGIPFSFTIQLADNGVHGYLLPSASIEPTARDAFEIITAMIDYI
ncbi:PREDICTED: uncharacterized protein LOC108371023 [Rhagoletis zephyria]|uniref:uncharacterized protein LOC108371023 n=1 Tax=Rhagoletis zephyria TaxID=28612 RepID=UPI0008112F0E|nr:PREDICTED: uncharacterized protein LOC108371023 [Rhagoletis zephyria]